MTGKKIKFVLSGCDIWFIASAPKDITLEQLLKQCDRIVPNYCDCGIRTLNYDADVEIDIDYNDVKKANEDVACRILEVKND